MKKAYLNIGIVGCGFVADLYMRTAFNYSNFKISGVTDKIKERASNFAQHYSVPFYESLDALLSDPKIDVILNLTNPHSHYEVSKAALLSGKHVYCEKPMAMELEQAKELKEISEEKNLIFSNAPCSLHSSAAQTLWKAIREDKIGEVKLVYAEMDDGPVHLMKPENWKSKLGVPWPYEEEFETGCTIEHIGYCLTWLLAMFGPAVNVTAFSHCVMPQKMPTVKTTSTPDFSVACIEHASGVITRLTCGILAPMDRSLTVVGEKGTLKINDFWDNHADVKLNRYSSLKLKAERKEWIRNNWFLRKIFNLDSKSLPLVNPAPRPFKLIPEKIKMDYFLGVSDLVNAIINGTKPLLDAEFSLHVNELSLKIHNACKEGTKIEIETSFPPLAA